MLHLIAITERYSNLFLSRILRPDGRTCLSARQGTRPAPVQLRLTAEKQKGKIFNIFFNARARQNFFY